MTKKNLTPRGAAGKKTPKPKVHKDLDGFEVSIDQFGELRSNMKIEKLNEFLDKNVDDKKLIERNENEDLKKTSKKNKPGKAK